VCACVCVCVCVYVVMCMCSCVYACVYVYICVCVCLSACLCVCHKSIRSWVRYHHITSGIFGTFCCGCVETATADYRDVLTNFLLYSTLKTPEVREHHFTCGIFGRDYSVRVVFFVEQCVAQLSTLWLPVEFVEL
jgi:hypothetical protein